MDAAFEFKAGIGSLAVYHKADFLVSSKLGFVYVYYFGFPALAFGIHGIHTEKTSRKKRRLFPSRSAADFHNNVAVVVWVGGEKEDFKLLRQLLDLFLRRFKLLLGKLFKLFVPAVKQLLCVVFVALSLFKSAEGIDNGGQPFVFLHQLCIILLIADHVRVLKLFRKAVKMLFYFQKFFKHNYSLFCSRIFLTARSAAARGSMISRPHFSHLSFTSIPVLVIRKISPVQGCFFFILTRVPTSKFTGSPFTYKNSFYYNTYYK